ncbi:serine-protein kinase ATM isoform X1 [Diorhabda sublineata]|uniref:serine-protein kinase ATM isoform X1 n=1 Tax=Diorhabda sublineata TaxID=1163346 RepID=UPI0024E1973F|nr:serine-protein kinase ATM isoform X1 [Diorhabda sublineata]
MSSSDLTDCCISLDSDKVNERKKALTKLSSILENPDISTELNGEKNISWRRLIKSLQKCLKKDAEKCFEDAKKKNISSGIPTVSLCADIFVQVINMAIKEDDQIDVSELIRYIIGCLNDMKMKKCYEKQFLIIVQKYILLNPRCRGQLDVNDWTEIYIMLKSLLEQYNEHVVVTNCFMTLIKYGPLCGLPPMLLRREFGFLTTICHKVNNGSPISLQENILETALEFCKHTAKDNRVSCCKFGEDIFSTFINIYELNGKQEKTKELMVQFLLLQVIIHHPNGVSENNSSSYAHNWNQWKKILKTIYSTLISTEIHLYFKCYQKNTSFFKINGENITLCSNFTRLFVEISKQLFTYPDLDVSMAVDCSFPSQKRQKTDYKLHHFIDNINETKSWLWIHLVCSIIKTYPNVIDITDYVSLLKILSTIQIENNEHNVIENLYRCLSTMLHTQDRLDINSHKEKINQLWKLIGNSTTRAFGLNQHKNATEKLMGELISRGIIDFEDVLPTYQSEAINLSLQSIKNFNAGLRFMILTNDVQKKKRIMQCILKSKNLREYKYLCSKETATFLVKLTFKQWQTEQNNTETNIEYNEYDDITNIYLKSLLDESVFPINKNVTPEDSFKNTRDVDFESAAILIETLEQFITNGFDTEEIIFSKIILLLNIANCTVVYRVLLQERCNNSWFINLVNELFNKKIIKDFTISEYKNEKDTKRLIEYINILNELFSLCISDGIMIELKELFPFDILKILFKILNKLQNEDKMVSVLQSQLKISITQALSSFSCICGSSLNGNQRHILEILANPNYNFQMDDDFKLFATFIASLKLSKPGYLPTTIITNILTCIHKMCVARYEDKAEDILKILHEILPHVAASGNDQNRCTIMGLLKPLYDNVKNNGPAVTLRLLNCLQTLCELDPANDYSQWSEIEIIKFIPDFLRSDYQEVRFKTIDVLVSFYKINAETNILKNIHLQEEVFLKMYEMSIAVFDVDGINTDERRADEIVSRTASVLLTFGDIATHCHNWIEESIYALMKIAHIKNIDSLDKILNIINKRQFGGDAINILEKYVIYLIEKWVTDGYKFENFYYNLLNCSTKFEFYKKYFEQCAPFLILTESDDIMKVAEELFGVNCKIIEKTAAKIFSRLICTDMDNMTKEILNKNKYLVKISKMFEPKRLEEVLRNNVDHIVMGILDFLTDEKGVKSYFGETVIYYTKYLSEKDINKCFSFVEIIICNNRPIGLFLSDQCLTQLEHLLLELKMNVYKSSVTKEKLKYFHRYAFFVEIITDCLTSKSCCRYFFVRDVLHTIFNIIENNERCTSMLLASCRFLNSFLKKILPKLSKTFIDFFHDVVSCLKMIYVTRKAIKNHCKDILNFLIVENKNYFEEEIKTLDKFPDQLDFRDIIIIQQNYRTSSEESFLEEQIDQFLNHKDILTKEDSLVYLRKALEKNKDELKELYDKLRNIRGFSEDCEKSLLHRLICTLCQLSYSTNQNVSLEAIRCLGELGPANLQTLVLQSEKELIQIKQTPSVILCGAVISYLIKYIVDCDINVVEEASKMLHVILNNKEAKKLVDLNSDFGYGPINKNYIIPYYPSTLSSPYQNASVNEEYFLEKLGNSEIWCPRDHGCHNKWITMLVSNLLGTFTDRTYLNKLVDICNVKVDFCESLLPLVIDLLIYLDNSTVTYLICEKIDYFFSEHWKITINKTTNEESIAVNKKSVKCMLNIINYLRLMNHSSSQTSRTCVEWKFDYLKISKAAEFCANHFSALYYSEIWCQNKIDEIQNENPTYLEQRSTMIDFIYEHEHPEYSETLHNILRNAYKAIGDFDALPGCGISFLLQPKYRVEYYKEQGKFDQVIHFYANQTSSSKDLINSFKSCSLYQIPIYCSKLEEAEYECFWRLSQWDFEEKRRPFDNTVVNFDFEKYRFYALKALHNNNQCAFEDASKSQFLSIQNHVRNVSLESSHNLYPILTNLQSLKEIEDFYESSKSKNLITILDKWKSQDKLIKSNDFQYVEPIITQRLVMLNDYLFKNVDDDDVKNYIIDLSLDFANWAKGEKRFKESSIILENLKKIRSLDNEIMTKIDLIDAQLSWSLNNTLVARQILNRLCKSTDITKLKSAALKLTGQYMSESNSENRTKIITNYFLASVKLMGSVKRDEEDIKNVMDTYDKLALFADKEYLQIKSYMKSDLFQKKIANMEQAKKAALSLQKQRKKTYEENKAATIHYKNSDIDEQEINSTKEECNQLLKLALKYYLLCLVYSDDKDIRIFRIMSLFLENRKNNEIWETIQEHLPKLPSYKYIIMLPQLIPHIASDDFDIFNKNVNEIIEKCAIEHPHHTLPILLSLANAHKDKEYDKSSTKTSTNDNRISTAKRLLSNLQTKNKGLCAQITNLNKVSVALISLAYMETQDQNHRKKQFDISSNQKIMGIKNFNDVLVPTCELAVSHTKNYSNIIGISSFKSTYEIVGGVNKPKKILCRGTNGICYSQLVKGQDDLRQDAVMQQVFSIMNNLLSNKKTTRHLLIRTYKIVPLSMRCGILKWADNSMPIGEYLIGGDSVGAHQKYRPSDKTPAACREIFKKCAVKPAEYKLKVYKDICQNFKPVFHHFFESFFPQPAVWYERRRAFIHSVATTSMCGYILGIGDRHTSNILIDKTTAEVIHIDFGIAFEQGRVLPTPETVPFRLTRDMVDAMGASGVEGIFRRSSEKTMEILRENAQTIITILEVLLYDPLYAWTVTAAEANKRQTESDNSVTPHITDTSEESTNVSAERALLRLREKLQGTELGHPTSIEHQVGNLIQQAVDPTNLCKLYVGWQPYV